MYLGEKGGKRVCMCRYMWAAGVSAVGAHERKRSEVAKGMRRERERRESELIVQYLSCLTYLA